MKHSLKNTLGNKMDSRIKKISGLLLIGLMVFSGKINAQITGYDYYKPLVINNGQVQGANTNFPVLISYTDTDLIGKVQPDGDDIVFATSASSTSILNHQLESFNSTTGALRVWVQVPTVSTAGETIYMFYGNNSATNQSTSAVWDNNYQLVMHMDNLSNATQISQSITDNGTTAATGQIGGGRDFERDQNDFISVADNSSLDITGQITISFWFRQESAQAPDYVTKGTDQSYEATSRNGIRTRFSKNGGNNLTTPNSDDLITGQWQYLVFAQSGTGRNIYQDGISVASDGNTDAFTANNNPLQISRSGDAVDGIMDEVRISNIARSANWIATEYNNQLNPGAFSTPGNEVELIPPSVPSNVAALALVGADIQITFDDVDEPAAQSGVGLYSIQRSTTSGTGYIEVGTITDNESASYIYTDNTAVDGTTYFYVVTAIDNDGNESLISTEVSASSDGSVTVPTNIVSNVVSATSVQITFNDADESGSGITSYSIKRSVTPGSGYSQIGTVTDNESNSYTFTDNTVTTNNEYYYIVTALDNLGNESGNSTEVSANTDLVAPTLTNASSSGNILVLDYNENLDVTSTPAIGDFTIRINGTPVSITNAYINTASLYIVYNPPANFGETMDLDYSSGVNPIQDSAGNQVVNLIAQSVLNNTADNAAPSVPSNVVATAIFGGDINISFDDVDEAGSGVDSYSIKRSTTSGSGYTQIGTIADNESVSYTFNDNNTVNGTTYYYIVTAIDGSSNESINSNESSAEAGSVTDNTAPVLNSSSIGDDILVLDYSENLNSSSVPSVSDFTLRINANQVTINTVTVNGDKISLTFTPDVLPGDNVEIDYTSGTNPIEDIAGNNASNLTGQTINNQPAFNTGFGPNPCPIVNGKDVAWTCFNGVNNATSITAEIGDLIIATVSAATNSSTIFSPNAIQSWASGVFSGDQFNGPQLNPNGASGNVTSFDIDISSSIPSDAIVFSLNRLRPNGGATSYTMEAFNGSNQRVDLTSWTTGQGTDGGVCTNTVSLNFANGGETIQFQPTVSPNPSCASSSVPIWFRISNTGVERIEIRKSVAAPDNIHIGIGVVADFGDAPNTYGTLYNSRSIPAAFHLLNNTVPNTVYFGNGVDGDGNGISNSTSTGDDSEVSSIGGGDDEDGIASLTTLNSAESNYSTTLSCTDGGFVGGWVDLDQSDTFDPGEFDSNICSNGSVTLNWNGITGLIPGTTYARFRIASNPSEVANPIGGASDGEVEDYTLDILDPLEPDLEISKTVDNSTPVEGENILFTVKVKNLGPDPASEIEVTDQLPAGLTYVGFVAGQGTYVNGTGIWDVGSIAVNDSTSLVIQATVNASTLGQTITNNASITSLKETDPNLSNNAASSGITVVPEASDVGVSMTVDDNTVLVGQTIEYEIIVVNNGPEDATGLSIIDQLPTGVTYQSNTATIGTYSNSTGIWSIGNLANGAIDTLIISAEIDLGTEGNQITNSADITALDQNDLNSANNTSAVSIDVIVPVFPTQCSEVTALTFIGSNTPNSGTAGQVGAIYRVNSVTEGVYAEFEILTVNNAILVNFDQTASGGLSENFQPQIEADNKTLSEGYIDFEISFYDSVTGNPRYLTFAASAVDVDGDPNGAREFAGFQRLTSFTVETTTDLIQNSEGIFTTFESAQPIVVNGIDPNNTDNLAFTTYTNEPKFRLRAGIKDPTTNGFTQRLFAFSFEPCVTFVSPTSSDIIDISVIKSVDFITPAVADTVTYTIIAKNEQGNSVGSIEVTDQIPAGLTYVPNSALASQGSYNNATGIWDIGTFTGQESATLVIKATVNTGQEGNSITNTASLSNFTGTDGNTSNNIASVDIAIFDPNSGLSCNEPPLFSFINPNLEQGVPLSTNAIYRFSNIASGVDALVKVVAINNATLDDIDNNGISNSPANFSPFFTALGGGGYIDWEIKLVQTGTNTPVKRSFALTGLDIDGFSANGNTLTDYLGFAQNRSSTVEGGTNLIIGSSGPFQTFESGVLTDGNGTFDLDHMAYIVYNYTSILQIRTGTNTSAGYSDDRLVDIDFTQCRNQDFANPVINTRNANIAVTKTADDTNPLENETVNFTITVQNNGSEDATELDINETLPTGLTLVQATPTQGSYNQLTKLWSIGSLANGASASLVLETTVNSGLSQDSLINTAYVQGLNQFDPNTLNDTSSVTLYLSVQISGTVFEDIKGDGYTEDLNFGDASGDQQALENVEVLLFKDGGDGLADGTDDEYLRSAITNNAGFYSFNIGEDADFWIVVNSKTGDLSNGTTWGEQTYASAGALCEDGTGNTTTKVALGHCFGGRRGGISDNITSPYDANDLANAEHVIKRSVSNTGISGIDFGFSFNVVTRMNDNDSDLGANRHSQGTLRQFILNANAITGANTMRFVPSVPITSSGNTGQWWKYGLLTELPVITDPLTTIDGTAYLLTAPKTSRNDNTGSVGNGGSIGIDNISINTFTNKEFEIDLSNLGSNAFVVNTAGAFVIRQIAIYNNSAGSGLKVQNASSGLIENNLIGSRASGVDQGSGFRLGTGVLFEGGSSTTLIQNNYVAFLDGSAIKSMVSNSVITVFKNEIYKAGLVETQADGIEGIGTWIITQNLIREVGTSGSADLDGGSGIEIGANSGNSSGSTIRNNTIRDNKLSGINVLNSVSNTLIEKNIIHGNGTNYTSASPKKGAGIKLTTPNSVAQQGIRITKNSFYDNKGISIDRVTGGNGEADGVSPNDGILDAASTSPNRGLDYPVFTLATLNGSVLTVEGYIGTTTTKLAGVYTIEIYKADNDGDNTGLVEVGGSISVAHGEGRNLIGTISTNSNGFFATDITLSGAVPLAFNDRITAIAISSVNNTSEFSGNQRVVPTGVGISGFVYHDTNHNTVKDASESGLENITIVLYNVAANSCKSVLTNAQGEYQFTNILNGNYNLIESFGQSVPTPDICTPAEVDPDNFISTTPNLRSVNVNNLPVFQNFGDYEGIKISGKVFNDNGISSGTGNDGILNGGETGFGSQTVKVVTSTNILIEQVASAADGTYSLYVPASTVGEGGTVKVIETNGPEKISTGGSAGTTSGSYSILTDETSFSISLGTIYTGVDFADVQVSRLLTDGERSAAPGAVVTFQHLFDPKTSGDVLFTTNSINNPTNPSWPVILYQDLNCNGEIDTNEPVLLPTQAISVVADQNVCLLLKVTAPYGLNDGASSTTTITATFSFDNTSPVIQEVLNRTDLVTIGTESAGLVILKLVDKAQALPGANLVYSIDYENLGDEPISQVEIIDVIPSFTTYVSSTCGALPTGITNCTITAPSVGASGTLKWTFTGTLDPGKTGTVTFTVKIDD